MLHYLLQHTLTQADAAIQCLRIVAADAVCDEKNVPKSSKDEGLSVVAVHFNVCTVYSRELQLMVLYVCVLLASCAEA